ncbi:glycosyltransferase [Prolixibacter denitrificans]|uniref:Glycosyl transferase n=1 Tax=Prolixibacter denitrificans TaxID=1541063 RepID=A0A2P8C8N4_9BACT|nr:glycosyltransferase family 2 protein [Prolixibacter denitrificans]PSK81324.1 hypothetical protein CLV93_110108 [Prolixibacter denitrificans]GET21591.1 glycosyl transferase [Prolixibacter denitrificans]
MLQKEPSIGVVIVNYVTYSDTITYVRDVLLQQRDISLEIVIIDNDSPNESYRKLQGHFATNEQVTVIQNETNEGYARANNRGIRYLEKQAVDYILVSNNDVSFSDTQLLSKLVGWYQTLESPAFISPVMHVRGQMSKRNSAWRLPDKRKEILGATRIIKGLAVPYLKRYYYPLQYPAKEALPVDCIPGSFFLGKTEVFKEVNYLDDQTFLYYEETILGEKVKRALRQNYIIQALAYEHNASKTIGLFVSHLEKHQYLLESKLRFWKAYKNAGWAYLTTLKMLYQVWKVEFFVFYWVKKLVNDSIKPIINGLFNKPEEAEVQTIFDCIAVPVYANNDLHERRLRN